MNNYAAVELIIRYSKTVRNPFSSNEDILKWKSKGEETALYIAVKCGYIDIVDLLMSKGACPVEPCCRGTFSVSSFLYLKFKIKFHFYSVFEL